MTETHSQCTIQISTQNTAHPFKKLWPVWLNGWLFIYKLSNCGFSSSIKITEVSDIAHVSTKGFLDIQAIRGCRFMGMWQDNTNTQTHIHISQRLRLYYHNFEKRKKLVKNIPSYFDFWRSKISCVSVPWLSIEWVMVFYKKFLTRFGAEILREVCLIIHVKEKYVTVFRMLLKEQKQEYRNFCNFSK